MQKNLSLDVKQAQRVDNYAVAFPCAPHVFFAIIEPTFKRDLSISAGAFTKSTSLELAELYIQFLSFLTAAFGIAASLDPENSVVPSLSISAGRLFTEYKKRPEGRFSRRAR